MKSAPDTIVLIHGLWMTPRSWEQWVSYYTAKGYRVVTPTYVGFEVEVEALRENPQIIADCDIVATADKIAAEIEALDSPPIIMGHSFGGALSQLMIARGLGCAGVLIDSAPTEGVRVNPLSQVRSLFPALKNPANAHKAVGFTPEEFHYAFTNTLAKEDSDKVWERYHIAAPGRWVWAYGLIANFKPGHQETWVDYDNDDRAPLLFIAGGVRPHHAALGEQVERQALQELRSTHGVLRVPGPLALDLRRARLGSCRRPRARVGREARQYRAHQGLGTQLRIPGAEAIT